MSEINAENISLIYPLNFKPETGKSPDPERFVISSSGRVKGLKVLKNVSFHLKSGDRLAIIGRNGAGKSTLLKVLGGILPIDHGHLQINGKVRGLYNIHLGLRPEASGYRNIYLSGLLSGNSPKMIRAKMAEIAEFTELGDFLSMPVSTYSAGMRMRLMFAAATAFDPSILLMDEWLGAGDDLFRSKAQERMQQLVEKAGILVLASHQQKLLKDTCNKAIWLHQGEVLAFGTLEDVLADYMNGVGQHATERDNAGSVQDN
ncbi:MAG: ABC transporter ATP-binding protein [bacterium]